MQNGEAPTDDIDQEWRRMLRLQKTRQREEIRKQVSTGSVQAVTAWGHHEAH